MLKRVHVAGVLALGLSGFAAAQTTVGSAALAPDQAPPDTGVAIHQSGSAAFLTPTVLDSTLTQHLAGAALLLHQEAALWPRLVLTTTIPAPIPEVTVDAAAGEEDVAAAPVPSPNAATQATSASTAELVPQAAAPAQATFNEDTSASAAPGTVHPSAIQPSAAKPGAVRVNTPEAQAELGLPALPSAALTGSVVDLALASPAAPTQAGSQLARLRLLQAQNPRRPSQAAAVQATPDLAVQKTAPVVAAPVAVRPTTVRAPTPEVTAEAAKPTAKPVQAKPVQVTPAQVKAEQAAPAPVITVNVRAPAVSAPLTTTARKAPAPAVVKTAAPVKQIATAARPTVPTASRPVPAASKPDAVKPGAIKTATIKPAPTEPVAAKPIATEPIATEPASVKPATVKPVAAKPAPVKPAAVQPQAAAPSSSSLGRPVASGARRTVSATAYSSDAGQTDNSPFVTATGTRVRPGVIALSRDLLRTFPYGSRVTIQDAGGVLNGRVFIVEDTMNARLRNTIDVWMGSRRQAYQWGRRTVTITAVR